MSVREQLVALAKLGRIDASTHDFDQELKEIPKEVDQLRESVSLLEGLLAKERRDLEEAQRLCELQDTGVKEAADGIAKAKAKSAKAKNAREAEKIAAAEALAKELAEKDAAEAAAAAAAEQAAAAEANTEAKSE